MPFIMQRRKRRKLPLPLSLPGNQRRAGPTGAAGRNGHVHTMRGGMGRKTRREIKRRGRQGTRKSRKQQLEGEKTKAQQKGRKQQKQKQLEKQEEKEEEGEEQ